MSLKRFLFSMSICCISGSAIGQVEINPLSDIRSASCDLVWVNFSYSTYDPAIHPTAAEPAEFAFHKYREAAWTYHDAVNEVKVVTAGEDSRDTRSTYFLLANMIAAADRIIECNEPIAISVPAIAEHLELSKKFNDTYTAKVRDDIAILLAEFESM